MDSIIKINTPHDRYFHGVMSDLRIAREFFQENLPLDIRQDEELRAQTWAGIMGFMMKHSRERDIINRFREAILLFKRIENLDSEHYFEITLCYLMQAADLQDLEPFKDIIKQELLSKFGEDSMTLAEALRSEGRVETLHSVALNLLRTQVPLNIIQTATGLSVKEIETLIEKERV